MNTRLKFHAIAIVAIIVIVTALYSVIGPQKAPAGAISSGGNTVEIYSATWGEQCNPAITAALAAQTLSPTVKDAEPLTLVTPDNALKALGTICNGKSTCELRVSADTIGIDPMPSCFKRLVASYRCNRFNRLTTLDIGQGEILTIDCLKPNTADAAAINAH